MGGAIGDRVRGTAPPGLQYVLMENAGSDVPLFIPQLLKYVNQSLLFFLNRKQPSGRRLQSGF